MKDVTFQAKIVAATTYSDNTNSSFVKETIRKIKMHSLADALPVAQKRGLPFWLRHLHKPTLALLALLAITLISSAVYAAVQFAPALIQLLGKETNQRGATEYSVAGLADCAKNYGPVADRFEVKADAPKLSDDEVHKILQASCEMKWLQDFPGKKWPTYGTNTTWKDGDTIYYTRLDMIGTLVSATDTKAKINLGGNIVDHTPLPNEKIKAFAAGEEIPLRDIKPGDTVFTVSRVSEVYHDYKNMVLRKDTNGINTMPYQYEQPKVIGLVALFKLSLPQDYYQQKQGYLTEIPTCTGNDSELCPQTPSIDVYPRVGGEGASNSYLKNDINDIAREISGTVTQLSDDSLTLKSRKGNLYTVTVGDAGFSIYNRNFTAAYTDIDAHLKIGSNVSIRYRQPRDADHTKD